MFNYLIYTSQNTIIGNQLYGKKYEQTL
jgi:hypothetical protein